MGAIILTDKQLEAKEKLEGLLQSTPRGNFQSYNDFNDYMAFLIKRIGKNIRLNKAVKDGKISYAEINEKRRKKILKYYNLFDALKGYGLKYAQNYTPSKQKLLNKLIEKSKNEELSLQVVDYLLENNLQLTDRTLATNFFKNYMYMGKNYNKIKELLYKKLFPRDLINEIIDTAKEEIEGSLLDPFTLTRRIETLLKKGKSEYYILQKFGDTEADRDLIKEILEELNYDNTDNLLKELDKLKKKGFDNQKIIQKMYTKGYDYSTVKEYLE